MKNVWVNCPDGQRVQMSVRAAAAFRETWAANARAARRTTTKKEEEIMSTSRKPTNMPKLLETNLDNEITEADAAGFTKIQATLTRAARLVAEDAAPKWPPARSQIAELSDEDLAHIDQKMSVTPTRSATVRHQGRTLEFLFGTEGKVK